MAGKKLSEVQRQIIVEMAGGATLAREFDVWGGYWHAMIYQNGMYSKVRDATVYALKDRGIVEPGENTRLFSGRQRQPYSLTDAGRAALATEDSE